MPRTLLLADDSVTIQRVVELTFADEDIDVVAVSDGDQAISSIEAHPPDIVLADIGMPGRTGYEVARHIKQSPRLAHIPVVLLTGAFEPVDQARATAAGCDAILAKPFEPQVVIARVKELLSRASSVGAHGVATLATAVPAAPRAGDLARLDAYFEELDAALTSLPETGQPAAVSPVLESAPREGAVTAQAEVGAASVGIPSSPLSDAFAALLAAEDGQPLPSPLSPWLARAVGGPPSDELVEEVTRRVLDRLSTTVVRTHVNDVVSRVAERLVREEIDRIKSSIT